MEKEKRPIYKKVWFWLLIAFMIFIFIPSFIEGIQEGINNPTTTSTMQNEQQEKLDDKQENGSDTVNVEKSIFLKASKGREFYEILCSVGELQETKPQEMRETILYESSNSNYSIEVEVNKTTNEIAYIRMMTLQATEYENFFNSISRLEYEGAEKSQIFNWIHDNLGKETSTKIGDVNFILTLGTNGKPILEVKKDSYDEYQKEQINKLINL